MAGMASALTWFVRFVVPRRGSRSISGAGREDRHMLRILVAIASYGTGNDHYLRRLIVEYRSMPFHIDIVVLSNIEKKPFPGIECLVGLPDRNPWSLPFAHKKLFADRADQYDMFIYSEDDILVTEANIRAFQQINPLLKSDEIAGFLRIEKKEGGEKSYPDMHGFFHWDSQSIRTRGNCILARYTNEHAACYILTKSQLQAAIRSGGFLVGIHEEKYDLLCTAATDPYTQCGMTKLIPVSRVSDFCVHHMSNKYIGKMGIEEAEVQSQIAAILRIAREAKPQHSLFNTETKLPRALYSKDYYEPIDHAAIDMIPKAARSVLSIGCGWGATERALVQRGLRVVAVPLDQIISTSAAADGVDIVSGNDLRGIAGLCQEKFDCVLCLNILHICESPTALLTTLGDCLAPGSKIVIRSPNMLSIRGLRNLLKDTTFRRLLRQKRLAAAGVHLSSSGSLREWCVQSQMNVDRIVTPLADPNDGALGRCAARIGGFLPDVLSRFLAPFLLLSATKSP